MNIYPEHSGEHLAQQCLDEAGSDYTLALDLVLVAADSDRRDHAAAALALWATLAPIANDNQR